MASIIQELFNTLIMICKRIFDLDAFHHQYYPKQTLRLEHTSKNKLLLCKYIQKQGTLFNVFQVTFLCCSKKSSCFISVYTPGLNMLSISKGQNICKNILSVYHKKSKTHLQRNWKKVTIKKPQTKTTTNWKNPKMKKINHPKNHQQKTTKQTKPIKPKQHNQPPPNKLKRLESKSNNKGFIKWKRQL